jgi:hypothetical protein
VRAGIYSGESEWQSGVDSLEKAVTRTEELVGKTGVRGCCGAVKLRLKQTEET